MDWIGGCEKVTAIFGRWPSFHDAEVLSLRYERTDEGFDVRASVHLWETVPEIDENGFFKHVRSTLVELRFGDCNEGLTSFGGFNGQNVLSQLLLTREAETHVRASFTGTYGLDGALVCKRVDVLDARPYPATTSSP